MLGYKSVRVFLSELFAGRMLLEEFYYGERLSRRRIITIIISWVFHGFAGMYWKSNPNLKRRCRRTSSFIYSKSSYHTLIVLGYGAVLLVIEWQSRVVGDGTMPFCLLLCGAIYL